MKFSTRELVTMAVFGALWGAVELGLGSVLHALNLPLKGLALAAIGMSLALIGRLFVPRPGSTLFIGVIATILKLFSIGNILIGPMIGILSEALIAELVLDLLRRPSPPAFILASAAGALWTLIQPFVTGVLLFGKSLLTTWLEMIEQGSRLFRLDPGLAAWIAAALVLSYLLVGALAGWLAWQVGRRLGARLGRGMPAAAGPTDETRS